MQADRFFSGNVSVNPFDRPRKHIIGSKTGVVLIAFLLLFTAGFGWAINYISFDSSFPRNPTGVNQGFISTSKDDVLFNATGTDLQNAVYHLNDTGGTVYLPVCNITTDTIYLVNNVNLVGQGNASILYLEDSSTDSLLYIVYNHSISISNLCLDGNKGGQIAARQCIEIRASYDITIKDCLIKNSWEDGILASTSTYNIFVTDCSFIACGDHSSISSPVGVLIQGDYSTVTNCYFEDCYFCGVAIEGVGHGKYNIVSDNIITGDTGSGIWVEGGKGENNLITNNIIYNLYGTAYGVNTTKGITCAGKNCIISNNYVDLITGAGIYVVAPNCTIENNIVTNILSDSGITLITPADYCNVIGNYIYRSNDSGIYSYNNDYNTFIGNQIIECNWGGSASFAGIRLYNNGKHIVKGNFIIGCKITGILAGSESFIEGNYIFNSSLYGIGGGYKVTNNYIENISTFGIFATDSNATFSGNSIIDIAGYGIYCNDVNISITDNHFNDVGNDGILLDATAINCFVSDNVFVNITNAAIDNDGTGNIIDLNVDDGKPSQNGAAAAAVDDAGTIAHGLYSTPDYVLCTGSVAGEMVSVTAIGATTFTVGIKDHAGNAGTTQTVYWYAVYYP